MAGRTLARYVAFVARRSSLRESPTLRRFVAVVIGLLGLVLALMFVKLALDWSDSLPYEGSATEARYILFMFVAAAIVAVGVVTAVVIWIRAGHR